MTAPPVENPTSRRHRRARQTERTVSTHAGAFSIRSLLFNDLVLKSQLCTKFGKRALEEWRANENISPLTHDRVGT